MTNYLELDSLSPLSLSFLYLDTPDYLADKIFISEQIQVKFSKTEYGKDDSPYVVIFCSIRKKDKKRFIRSMEQLKKKMLFNKHYDYPEACENLLSIVDPNES